MEWLTPHLVDLLQHVKYCSEWQNWQVGGLKCALHIPYLTPRSPFITMVTAYLLILPLTAILYVAANEQLDVTSRQLNSLALATGSGM